MSRAVHLVFHPDTGTYFDVSEAVVIQLDADSDALRDLIDTGSIDLDQHPQVRWTIGAES